MSDRRVELPGVLTTTAIYGFVGAIALFVIGFVGQPDDMQQYSRAFWISMALRGTAIVVFFSAIVQTRAVRITLTENELICERSWRRAIHVPREGLELAIEARGPAMRPSYVIVARTNGQHVALATRADADDARAQVAVITEALQ